MDHRRSSLLLAAAVAVAFLLRTGASLVLCERGEPLGDLQYDLYGQSLLQGRGYRIDGLRAVEGPETPGRFGLDTLYSFKPPLYPAFLALVYAGFGRNFLVLGIVQAVLGAATCLPVYRVGTKLFGRASGLLAAGLLAAYPYLIVLTTRVSDTTLFTLLLSLSVLCACRVQERPSVRRAACLGLSLGCTTLCRPMAAAWIPFVCFWLFFRVPGPWMARFRPVLFTVLFAGLTMLPWAVRNTAVHGRAVVFGTNGGYTFWQCHNAHTEACLRARKDFDAIAFRPDTDWTVLHGLSEAEQDAWFYTEGFRYLVRHPGHTLKLALWKLGSLWDWRLYPAAGGRLKNGIYSWSYGPLLLLAAAGALVSATQWRQTSVLLLLFLSFSLVYAVFYGKTIYRAPLDPWLTVFAARFMTGLRGRAGGGTW